MRSKASAIPGISRSMVRSRTTMSPEATAPMASSGWPGMPTLRTSITSSGASSAAATSEATGTPPRGSASTNTGAGSRRCCISRASAAPAAARSANTRGVNAMPAPLREVPEGRGRFLGGTALLAIRRRVGDEPPLGIELCEHATLPDELLVPALLDQLSVLEHQDQVGGTYRREPVCDD